jgi:surface polysaccharide O-acyltransferase-like enzyme
LIDKYNSTKILALSFLFKVIVVISHSSNLVLNLGNESTKIRGTLNSFVQNLIATGISSIAVPILFVISGYLFFSNMNSGTKEEFTDKFKKRFKTLVIPFLFWSLFSILLFYILQSAPASKPFFTKRLVANFSFSRWIYTIFYLPIAAQLWFIRDLIILIAFTPLLYKLFKTVPKISLMACFILWFFNVKLYLFAPDALFFFIIGSYWGIIKIQVQDFHKVKSGLALFVLWITLEVIKTYLTENHIYISWLINLLHKTAIITGIIGVWYSYDLLYKNDDISKKKYYPIFKYSFWIYVTHQPILNIIKKALYYFIGINNWSSPIIYVLSAAITLLLITTTGILLKKYYPKIYFFTTGGR